MNNNTQISKAQIIDVFKKNLTDFLDDLIILLSYDPKLVIVRHVLLAFPLDKVLDTFADRILPYKDMVLKRDENFFINETSDIFDGIHPTEVGYFKNIWLSDKVSDADKQEIWNWFNVFLRIAMKWRE